MRSSISPCVKNGMASTPRAVPRLLGTMDSSFSITASAS
jgi:hypothetical protein